MTNIPANRKVETRSTLRLVRGAGLILLLLFLIWTAGRSGYASLLSTYAARTSHLSAAAAAVSFSPRDAQNHLIRGGVLQAKGEYRNAVAQYERAVSLRPDDYTLWLTLAHARELDGDGAGALAAATYAVSLAPHYAKPHWQLGNLLLRAGRAESGFGELRAASERNPALLPGFIDLAWRLSEGKVELVLRATDPRSPKTYRALAGYFRKRGKTAEAVEMFKAAGSDAGSEIASERRAFLTELLGAKQFAHARSLWVIAHPTGPYGPSMFDPGFEQESDLDEPGFGWRAGNHADEVSLTLDRSEPAGGQFSLLVSFNGASEPSQPVVSQLVSVNPRARYQLQFAVRTEEIVSAGLPAVIVADAASVEVLGQSGALPQTSGGWRNYTIDFTTTENAEAIQIKLQRGSCGSPCPIFGRLWLDNFSLRNAELRSLQPNQ